MALRSLSWCLGGMGVVAFVVAGYLYFQALQGTRAEEDSAVVVDDAERVLNDVVAGHDYEVCFVIQNRGSRAARVIGVAEN